MYMGSENIYDSFIFNTFVCAFPMTNMCMCHYDRFHGTTLLLISAYTHVYDVVNRWVRRLKVSI